MRLSEEAWTATETIGWSGLASQSLADTGNVTLVHSDKHRKLVHGAAAITKRALKKAS